MLKVGDKAPDFAVTDDSGATVSLRDYRGKNLILYFYPESEHSRLNQRSVRVSRRPQEIRSS